jgi:DNA-3-methyladenine glycosylase II
VITAKTLLLNSNKNNLTSSISFDEKSLPLLCNKLARKDPMLKAILKKHGYPPYWKRALHFETLVQIILEQQVSLASAKAAFLQLKRKIGKLTPEKIMQLSDADLRAAYFSKQKTSYTRNLALAILNRELNLKSLVLLPDDKVRDQLIKIKGIGNWTVDVFLMMVLSRTNLFPFGDIALVNSLKHEMQLPKETTKASLEKIVASWEPYKTIASFILWWAYIKRKNIKI